MLATKCQGFELVIYGKKNYRKYNFINCAKVKNVVWLRVAVVRINLYNNGNKCTPLMDVNKEIFMNIFALYISQTDNGSL